MKRKTNGDQEMMRLVKIFLTLSVLMCASCASNTAPTKDPRTDFLNGQWRGVTIGKSSEQEVLTILGSPNEQSGKKYAYRRDGRQLFVEFSNGVVDQIVMNPEEARTAAGLYVLLDLVKVIGRPDWVTWSAMEESRTMVWASKGVAATVFINNFEVDSTNNLFRSFALFPKMDLKMYQQSRYYIESVPTTNPNAIREGQLGKVEDPYRWSKYFGVTATP